MLKLKFVVQNIDLVISKLKRRNDDFSYLKRLINLNEKRKETIFKIEEIRFKQNRFSDEIEKFKKKNASISEILQENKSSVKKELKELEYLLNKIKIEIYEILYKTPNIPHDSVPLGKNSEDNLEIYRFSTNYKKDFLYKDHTELNKKLGIFDFERATKITGSRFVVLKGMGAKLERSLINFMIDHHIKKGYKEIITPFIVNEKSMFSSGQLPKFKSDLFEININEKKWYLNPTAEVPIINLHRNEILDIKQLPIKYVGFTTCFRQEAGAAGKDTKGIFRQKQFNKVELIQFTEPKNSYKVLEKMLNDSEEILKELKIPYRVVLLSTGDLGFNMSKTYDIEVWMPGQNKYREIASISNAENFQAVRANIKFKNKEVNEYVHTLNASALAIGRTMIAILENYQNKDGSVTIPKNLVPYMGVNKIY
ncbi:serine--tRNA ligase [Candidatus Phytoplasma sacchari]|nr:serine--tRNA ligase [Candidatus Phytoplasma sacchari]KAB8122298.1 serine--tRNA ligase [Candidatus Phytoplasma sacchari]